MLLNLFHFPPEKPLLKDVLRQFFASFSNLFFTCFLVRFFIIDLPFFERGNTPPLHTQIYTIIHTASRYFLFFLFQVGIYGRYSLLKASKIRAALFVAPHRSVRRHSATPLKIAFYIQTLFSGKGRFYFVRGRGIGGGRVPFDSVSADFFALRILTYKFFFF